MTHLLQYFPQLSLRPDNLPELRRLILQLAVEGKLTAEWRKDNPDVEPAAELLSRIAAEKAALVKAKKIRKSKPLPPVGAEEMPFELPEGWVWCRLKELGAFSGGGTPSKRISSYWGGNIPWVSPKDMKSDFITTTQDYITEEGVQNSSAKIIPQESILIVGRSGILARKVPVAINQVDCAVNQDLKVIIPYFKPLTTYLKLFFHGTEHYLLKEYVKYGMTVHSLKYKEFELLPVALPPLPEQQAIVQTVDALLQELDQLQQRTAARLQLKADYATAALRRLTTAPSVGPAWEALSPHFHTFFNETGNVQALRAAILQLAVQGKLTAHWRKAHPDVEPATELLSRIQAEKAELVKAKKIRKEKPLPPVGAAEVPFVVPEGWVWCRMQEVGLFQRGKSKHRPRNDRKLFENGKYPLVQTGNVADAKNHGGLVVNHSSMYNDFGLAQSKIWPKGTLCITIAANIAETGFLSYDACFPDSVVGFTSLGEEVTAKYVEIFISTAKTALEEFAPSTAQKNINLSILYALNFPLPPLPEQHAIVQAVEELLGLCTALESAAARRERVLGEWVRAVVAGG
jgi:type I restriction enzyme S subunit